LEEAIFLKITIGMDAGRILIVFSKNIASSKFHYEITIIVSDSIYQRYRETIFF